LSVVNLCEETDYLPFLTVTGLVLVDTWRDEPSARAFGEPNLEVMMSLSGRHFVRQSKLKFEWNKVGQ
jgi:hypothetical protein